MSVFPSNLRGVDQQQLVARTVADHADHLPRAGLETIMSIRVHRAIGVGAALLALAWGLPATAKNATWPQIGYNSGHTGFNSSEKTINSKNVTKLAKTATFTTQAAPYQPMISRGVMYVRSTDQNLYVWKLATGKLVWSIPLATLDGPNGMVIGDGVLVATCGFTNSSGICAFDAKTGKSLWSYGLPNGGPFTPPVIAGSTVYLGQSGANGAYNSYNMVAVDLKTGAQLWAFGPCAGSLCSGMGENAPAVDKGMVYFGCTGSSSDTVDVDGVCALNASTGALVWQYQLGGTNIGDGEGRLIASGGTVYAAYRTAFCNQCDYTLHVTALNGTTGAELWDMALTGDLDDSYDLVGPPVLGPDGSVYQGITTSNNPNQANLFALNSDGTIRWSQSTISSLPDPPTLVGSSQRGALFFGGSEGGSSGTTCAFDARTGSLLWESSDGYEAGDFAPVVTGGVVYNDCNFNDICAYKLK
jgi:outer membrane protein assembly factor BamB